MESQNPVHVFATWKIKSGNIEKVLELLEKLREESLKETGALFYKVHQQLSDPFTLVLFEGYTSEAAVAEHRNSSHFQDLAIGQIIPLLESREVVVTTPLN